MTRSGKLFDYDLTEWFIEAGFIQYRLQMYIYYEYAPYGTISLFYIMLMIVSIDIHLELLENGLWTL